MFDSSLNPNFISAGDLLRSCRLSKKPIRPITMNVSFHMKPSTALTWNDVDFENEILDISKTVCKYYKRDKQGKRLRQVYHIATTKTAHSNRKVPTRTFRYHNYRAMLYYFNGSRKETKKNGGSFIKKLSSFFN